MKRFILTTTIASLVLATLLAPFASAQSGAGGGQALEIGPPVLNLTANPGQVIQSSINIRDVSKVDLLVSNEINDFTANGEDGTPQIILDTTQTSPYSIRSWIQPLEQITLKSKEIKSIPITIYVPADAAPGGYYGIIRFTGTAPNLDQTGVALSASLGTLIFLRVNGEVKEDISIDRFFANTGGVEYPLYEFKPVTLSVRLKNNGNIYEQPTGLVTVKDMFGKAVVNLPVNAEERVILPDSTRKFDQVIDETNIGTGLMFGRYTAEVTIKYGSKGQSVTSTTSFWVIPYKLIIAGIILLIVAFFLLRIFIRRYNQHIVQKATGVKPVKPAKPAKTAQKQGLKRFKRNK